MKYLGIALLILAIAGQILGENVAEERDLRVEAIAARSFSSKLRNLLHVELRRMLKEGHPSNGIPIMDPLNQDVHAFQINNKFAKVQGVFNDLYSNGVAGYKVDHADVGFWSKKATFQLTFPRIYFSGNYSLNGVVLQKNIYGNGEFQATVKNLKVHAVIALQFIPVSAKSMKLTISLGALDFNATGLYNNKETSKNFSVLISKRAPQFIAEHHNEITNYLSPILLKYINSVL